MVAEALSPKDACQGGEAGCSRVPRAVGSVEGGVDVDAFHPVPRRLGANEAILYA